MYRRVLLICVLLLLVSVPGIPAENREPGKSLAAQATIRRDTYGIPHILAETEEAAAFGFGYAQAEDHCVEIARRLIGARGQAARYFGREGIESDFALAQFDNYREARLGLRKISSLYRKLIRAYIAGVNRYVAGHRTQLPDWIPEFTEVDVLANSRAGAAGGLASPSVIRALAEKYGQAVPARQETDPGPSQAAGSATAAANGEEVSESNALALAGSRTVSGAAMLLGNPHLSWSSLYWEAQVTVPGKINFYGSTLAAIPVLRAGFNEHIGFVTTNNAPDLSDIYALPLDPRKPDHYLFEGRSRPLARREATIEIRNDDGTLREESRVFWYSHIGPIIYRIPDKAFAVKASTLQAFRYFEGFYRLSRSRNLKEYKARMRENLVPTSNFTYADADGNILYIWNGRVPVRVDDDTNYRLDVPGDTGKYVWKKLHKLDDFPQLLNPRDGSIQNANNPPWFTSLQDRLDPERYPSYFERGELGLRPQLVLELLESRRQFSPEDLIALKYTNRMLLADRVKPALIEALRQQPQLSAEARQAMEILEAWDNRVAADSRGALLFQRFWESYRSAVRQPYAVPWDPNEPAATPRGIADAATAVRLLEETVRRTVQNPQSFPEVWGDLHRFRLGTMDLPADGSDGSFGCYRVMRFAPAPDGKRIAGRIAGDRPLAGFGDAWILLVQFSRPVQAWSILAYGQTTRSDSAHSSDQIQTFASHQLRPVWYYEADILAHLERSYRPE